MHDDARAASNPSVEEASLPVEEADFAGTAGPLHRRSVYAPAGAIARLAVLHGYGDHGGRYVSFMRWMAARGVTCHALDFRGHGRSAGRRGYVRRWDEYLDDLRAFLARPELVEEGGDAPLFALGHSHGGLVLAVAATRDLPGVAGCVLVSPYLRGATVVPLPKRLVGRVANVLLPWLRLPTGLSPDSMSSDPTMVQDSRADPLLLRTATPRWFFGAARAQADLRPRAAQFKLSLLCLAGSADVIADPRTTAAFCAAAGSADKAFHLLPSRRHELLRETDRRETFGHIYAWIRDRARQR